MNKLILLLMGIFLIGLVSATIYSTPGAVPEPNGFSSEVPISEDMEEDSTDIKIDLTNKKDIVWITFVVVIIIVGIFLIIRREIIIRKRKKKSSGLVPKFVDDALKNMKEIEKVQQEENRKVKVSNEEYSDKELNDLIDESGLEELKDKIEGVNNYEPKR